MTLVLNLLLQSNGNKNISMKKTILFICLVFLTVLVACGQQKKYVSYTVQKGETIKTIARDNDIKVRDLLRLNPDVSRKPDAKTVIIIPNRKYKTGESTSTTVSTTDSYKGKTHRVLRKETLFSIAQKYEISVAELKLANNMSSNSLRTGSLIKIPSKKVEKEDLIELPVAIEDLNSIMHLVVKDDTIYNLTKRYDISKEELLGMNPSLKDGLKLGLQLKVGEKSDSSIEVFNDRITNKPLNVLLMLPYKLSGITDYQSEFDNRNSLLNITTDFHLGVLMAVDSLKKQGQRINLQVVDTHNRISKIHSVINTIDKDSVDVIIGPLFLKNAKEVARKINVPVIAPMYSKNQESISDANLVKVAPDKKLMENKLVDYLLENYDGENIIISGDDSAITLSKISKLSAKLRTHDSIDKIKIIKPEEGYIKKEKFTIAIDSLGKNWVVLLGEDNITTNDVVNNLGVIPKEKTAIRLFSFGKGSNFDNISNNQLSRLGFTYPQENFEDNASDAAINFAKKYKRKYNIRPSIHAIKGFDVTYDTLLRMADYDSFNEGSKAGISERIGTKFEYDNRLFGSTENKGVFLIQYGEGLELKSIN
ncbi:MAG: LysM repeat protein [Candidatus Azotimanducaceae bacterium]|jgi:LysM repeat protein